MLTFRPGVRTSPDARKPAPIKTATHESLATDRDRGVLPAAPEPNPQLERGGRGRSPARRRTPRRRGRRIDPRDLDQRTRIRRLALARPDGPITPRRRLHL